MPAARVTAQTKIFELDIVLDEVQPQVRRRVQVPGEVDLAVLHEVVQSAMGWTNSHLHEFEIAGRRYGIPDPDWGAQEIITRPGASCSAWSSRGTGSGTSTTSATTGPTTCRWT